MTRDSLSGLVAVDGGIRQRAIGHGPGIHRTVTPCPEAIGAVQLFALENSNLAIIRHSRGFRTCRQRMLVPVSRPEEDIEEVQR